MSRRSRLAPERCGLWLAGYRVQDRRKHAFELLGLALDPYPLPPICRASADRQAGAWQPESAREQRQYRSIGPALVRCRPDPHRQPGFAGWAVGEPDEGVTAAARGHLEPELNPLGKAADGKWPQ